MKRLLLLVALAGCMNAEAGPAHGPAHGPQMIPRQGGDAVPDAGSVLDDYTWDLVVDGRACPGVDGGVGGLAFGVQGTDAGQLAWAYGADAGAYSCNGSTTGLTNIPGYENTAMVLNGASCWNLNSTVHPAIVDGQDIWCRLIFQTGNNAGSAYMTSYGSVAGDFLALYMSSTERQTFSYRTASSTALIGSSAVLPTGAWDIVDWFYAGASPTNPRLDQYLNGTATPGTEHTANLIGMTAGQRIAVGGATNGVCGITASNSYTILSIRCAYGANAAQFTGEAMHDEDCQQLGICP